MGQGPGGRAGYGELLARLRSVRPLVRASADARRVAVDRRAGPATAADVEALSRIVDPMCDELSMPRVQLTLDDHRDLNIFERAISRHLAVGPDPPGPAPSGGGLAEPARDAAEPNEDRAAVRVKSADGTMLNAYGFGDASSPPVVIINAHGMPVGLCLGWVRALLPRYRVLTWETRTMFPPGAELEAAGIDLDSHVADLWSVMDHFGVGRARLMGFCTGVSVALQAAVCEPARFHSLTLGSGQFFWGAGCATTETESSLQEHLKRFSDNRRLAERFQRAFARPGTQGLFQFGERLAHCTLYPWATGELLYRYARICAEFMSTPLADWARAVSHPTLLVFGELDQTVHPDSSRHAASLIPGADVYAEPRGDHLSMLVPSRSLRESIAKFFASTD